VAHIDPNTEERKNRILTMVTTILDPSRTHEERYGPFVDEAIASLKKMKGDIVAGRLLTAAVAADQYAMGLSGLSSLLIQALKQSEDDGATSSTPEP
jgi:hypothetical protein